MKVIVVDSQASAWDSFVQSAQYSTPYHQFKWKMVITKSFGHQCHYCGAIDRNEAWQGVLPLVHMRSKLFGNFLISVPFVNYGGLLYKRRFSRRSSAGRGRRTSVFLWSNAC